jgi:hypothetical protein
MNRKRNHKGIESNSKIHNEEPTFISHCTQLPNSADSAPVELYTTADAVRPTTKNHNTTAACRDG